MTAATGPAVPDQTVPLPSGRTMPLLGFGTWQLKGAEAISATRAALQVGYRHLDTATMYGNEGEVGQALADAGVALEDVFVTTKLPPSKAGDEPKMLTQSLELLGTDHVDLWLIHWTPDEGVGVDLWKAFVRAREDGLAVDIGVSNYALDEIDELTEATGVSPAVNQIEWSPLLYDADVLEGHRQRGIVLEGYSALRGGTLEHPTVMEIADRLGRTPAQVVIAWHLRHGVVVIPKSREPDRIASNADVGGLELSERDVAELDALGQAG